MRQDSYYSYCWSAPDAWAFASVSFDGKLVRASQIFPLDFQYLWFEQMLKKIEDHIADSRQELAILEAARI